MAEAVEALTKPQTVKIMQGDMVTTAEAPALLVQLDNAIRASLGGSAAGASTAFEGSIVNSAALMKLAQISEQIAYWCRKAHARIVRGDTIGNLTRWHESTFGADLDPIFHVTKLREWAATINSLLDPPSMMDLPDSCPADDCGADRWWKNREEGGLRPLVVYFRRGEPVDNGVAECRACGRKWGVRELAYALEHRGETPA